MKQPLLSLKEEQEATVKWKKTKDLKSLHLLISSYEKLIISTAIKFRKYGLPFGDLVQEGNIGILKAAYKFDPKIKVRFSTYAIWWIKSSIQEFILRNWSIVRIGSTSTQKFLFFQFSKIQNKINNLSNGSDAIKEELAKKLKINTFDIDKLSESPFKKDYQIDQTNLDSEDNRSPINFLKDSKPLPEEVTINDDFDKNRKLILKETLKILNNKEKHIILKRHLTYNPITLEAIGKELNLSKERVRQLEFRAMTKIKKRILSKNLKRDLF
jgi:RNA polymerase sigma-32 factor